MVELQPDEFCTVSGLFEGIEHNAALVFSVIERHSRGRVFVNHGESTTSAFLYNEGSFFYIGGSPENETFNGALEPLVFGELLPCAAEKELVLFAFSEEWRAALDRLLGPRGAIRIQRKVFKFNPEKFSAHAGWRARLPQALALRLVDDEIAEKHPEFRPVLEPGSQRFGVCLVKGDEPVSTCSAVCVGRGEAEIDVHTAEPHQGKGYATLAACAFIEECLARRLTPSWSCWPFREASLALALKLGFDLLPDAPAHYWAENM